MNKYALAAVAACFLYAVFIMATIGPRPGSIEFYLQAKAKCEAQGGKLDQLHGTEICILDGRELTLN